jgi:hypothetical protein
MIRFPRLSTSDAIHHAFFTREGGVSDGIFSSLNCGFGSDDARDAVAENRRRVAERMEVAADALLTVYQVHSPDVVTVDAPWSPGDAPKADAMVTDRPGIALGILTADCAPVLFADPEAGVVGAAHAGWRGAFTGVTDATIDAMCELGAEASRIHTAIGPCIGPRSYEVGAEFRDRFTEADAANDRYFAAGEKQGKFLFDLPRYVTDRLNARGVASVSGGEHDTLANETRYFSYRRTTLRGEPDYGRMIAAISIRDRG